MYTGECAIIKYVDIESRCVCRDGGGNGKGGNAESDLKDSKKTVEFVYSRDSVSRDCGEDQIIENKDKVFTVQRYENFFFFGHFLKSSRYHPHAEATVPVLPSNSTNLNFERAARATRTTLARAAESEKLENSCDTCTPRDTCGRRTPAHQAGHSEAHSGPGS